MSGPAPFINQTLIELARRDDTLIVFPHTQRTGGKAFRDQVLGAVYGAGRIYSATLGTGEKHWREVTSEDLRGFRVYTGASNYADLNKGRPAVFLALLRHPLYRAVSLYFYCRQRKGHKLHEIANRLSLAEFYPEASRIYPIYVRNTQCLRICGKPDAETALRTIRGKYLGVGFSSDIGAFAGALGNILNWPKLAIDSSEPDAERYDKLIDAQFGECVLEESAEDLKLYETMAAGLPTRSRFSLAGVWKRISPRFSLPKRPSHPRARPKSTSAIGESEPPDADWSMPPSPFDELDNKFFEYRKQNPKTTYAQYFMMAQAKGVKRGASHHSLGKNIDGLGEDVDFWKVGAYKATKYIRAAKLTPSSRVIEYGCGSLRIGAHFIRFLDAGNFLGLDVIPDFYEIGKELIGPDLMAAKAPRFAVISEDSIAKAEGFGADLVYCSAVCIHVHPDETQAYFTALARLCRKPGARLLFDAVISDKPIRYRHRNWAWPLGFFKKSLADLEFVQVSHGNQRMEGDAKITLAMLEFRRPRT